MLNFLKKGRASKQPAPGRLSVPGPQSPQYPSPSSPSESNSIPEHALPIGDFVDKYIFGTPTSHLYPMERKVAMCSHFIAQLGISSRHVRLSEKDAFGGTIWISSWGMQTIERYLWMKPQHEAAIKIQKTWRGARLRLSIHRMLMDGQSLEFVRAYLESTNEIYQSTSPPPDLTPPQIVEPQRTHQPRIFSVHSEPVSPPAEYIPTAPTRTVSGIHATSLAPSLDLTRNEDLQGGPITADGDAIRIKTKVERLRKHLQAISSLYATSTRADPDDNSAQREFMDALNSEESFLLASNLGFLNDNTPKPAMALGSDSLSRTGAIPSVVMYNEYAPKVIAWIGTVLDDEYPTDVDLLTIISTGNVLCHLVCAMFPKIQCQLLGTGNEYTIHKIVFFLEFCKTIGLKTSILFTVEDLLMPRNEDPFRKSALTVLRTICALERQARKKGWNGPAMNLKDSDEPKPQSAPQPPLQPGPQASSQPGPQATAYQIGSDTAHPPISSSRRANSVSNMSMQTVSSLGSSTGSENKLRIASKAQKTLAAPPPPPMGERPVSMISTSPSIARTATVGSVHSFMAGSDSQSIRSRTGSYTADFPDLQPVPSIDAEPPTTVAADHTSGEAKPSTGNVSAPVPIPRSQASHANPQLTPQLTPSDSGLVSPGGLSAYESTSPATTASFSLEARGELADHDRPRVPSLNRLLNYRKRRNNAIATLVSEENNYVHNLHVITAFLDDLARRRQHVADPLEGETEELSRFIALLKEIDTTHTKFAAEISLECARAGSALDSGAPGNPESVGVVKIGATVLKFATAIQKLYIKYAVLSQALVDLLRSILAAPAPAGASTPDEDEMARFLQDLAYAPQFVHQEFVSPVSTSLESQHIQSHAESQDYYAPNDESADPMTLELMRVRADVGWYIRYPIYRLFEYKNWMLDIAKPEIEQVAGPVAVRDNKKIQLGIVKLNILVQSISDKLWSKGTARA